MRRPGCQDLQIGDSWFKPWFNQTVPFSHVSGRWARRANGTGAMKRPGIPYRARSASIDLCRGDALRRPVGKHLQVNHLRPRSSTATAPDTGNPEPQMTRIVTDDRRSSWSRRRTGPTPMKRPGPPYRPCRGHICVGATHCVARFVNTSR